MMMKNSISVFVVFMVCLSVLGQSPLNISFPQNPGEEVKVMRHHIFNDETEELTRFVLDGSGEIPEMSQPILDPGFYIVEIRGIGKLRLAIDKADTPLIKRTANEIKIKHSGGTELLTEFERTRKSDFQQRVKTVRKQAARAQKAGNEEKAARLSAREQEAYNGHRDFLIDYAYEHMRGSIAGYEVLTRRKSGKNIRKLEMLVKSIAKKYPDHELNEPAADMVEALSKTLPGAKAPDFTLPDTNGRNVSLPDVLGENATLIEFWASWCAPCRRLNPELNELYRTYSERGVNFVFISLDKRANRWESARKKDELRGIHLSDLKGYKSKVTEEYSVTSIPAGFLLNAEGEIIEKDLKGDGLRKKLEELTKE